MPVAIIDDIIVSITDQQLHCYRAGRLWRSYGVSTAQNGPGEVLGSGCTPRGLHTIRAKVGHGAKINTVFVGRRPTGEIYSPQLASAYPKRDWILTRILWLRGCQPGLNRWGTVDTLRRFIYIHGCPDDLPMGIAQSHGCIRMRNDDILALFDQIEVGTPVQIQH